MKLSTLLFCFLLSLLSTQAIAGVQCSQVFDSPLLRLGKVRSDFEHNTDYKVLVPNQSEIKNQCSMGVCHMYSWASELEHNYIVKNREQIKISMDYLDAKHWLATSLDLLRSSTNGVNPALGRSPFGSRDGILNYGIIPDEAWTGAREFQKAQSYNYLNEYVKNIVAHAKWAVKSEPDQEKQKLIVEKAQQEIETIFTELIGKFPESFTYQGQTYTPHSFIEKFFPELTIPIVVLQVAENKNQITKITNTPKGPVQVQASDQFIQTSLKTLEAVARRLLDQGFNVYLSYQHEGIFVEKQRGIMSINAFDLPENAGPLGWTEREYFKDTDGMHAVQIVGYDYDQKTGKVIKWKIKNSWGLANGDQGYFHMYDDYFKAFARSITFWKLIPY